MEKITIKRTGEIKIIENPNKKTGYKMAMVQVSIKGKTAQITFEEKYKSSYTPNDRSSKMISWKFVTGDPENDESPNRLLGIRSSGHRD